jgi:hypothetical protein
MNPAFIRWPRLLKSSIDSTGFLFLLPTVALHGAAAAVVSKITDVQKLRL